MSDFDKEAEREKLREKYEQEQEERAVAEKMSELLLQGATMTNAHCSDCGDPVFRYDGQEFCASCEKAVDRDTGTDADADDATEDADGETDDGQNIEVTAPSDDARVQFGSGDQSSQPDPQRDVAAGTEAETAHADTATESTSHRQQSPDSSRTPERTREVPGMEPADDEVALARQSLERTLARFSQHAEATDDPQRAREYLAAAREAAETLAALRQ
ncbi:MAG: uncharacterized Zn finger protein (UPF0148 family) [Haloarculaceae archaeon]|jgi:uncharacterized Zn finger protein (UPF0148 family)